MNVQVRVSVEKCMGTPFIFHEEYIWDISYNKKKSLPNLQFKTKQLFSNENLSSEKKYNFAYSQKELKDKVLHMKNLYSNNVPGMQMILG